MKHKHGPECGGEHQNLSERLTYEFHNGGTTIKGKDISYKILAPEEMMWYLPDILSSIIYTIGYRGKTELHLIILENVQKEKMYLEGFNPKDSGYIIMAPSPKNLYNLKRANPNGRHLSGAMQSLIEGIWHEIWHHRRSRGKKFPEREELIMIWATFKANYQPQTTNMK